MPSCFINRLYKQALAIREKALGSDHPDIAVSLSNLGVLYTNQGKYRDAEPLYQRALAIRQKALGTRHPDTAHSMSSLAGVLRWRRKYKEAEALDKDVLAIHLAVFGPNHPATARSYNSLALDYEDQERYVEAEPLFKQALAIERKAFGPEHESVGYLLSQLGSLYLHTGKYVEAEEVLTQALAISKKALGPDDLQAGTILLKLACVKWARQHPESAEVYFDQSQAVFSKILAEQFAYMTENDRLTFLNSISGVLPSFLSFGYYYRNERPQFAAKMYDALLWGKGMVASSVTAQRAALLTSGDSQALALFEELTNKKNQLAALFRAQPTDREQWRNDVDRLQSEIQDLEEKVSRRSAAFAEQKQLALPQWQQVRDALKPNEAAVEFARFHYWDRTTWTKKSYYFALVARSRAATEKPFDAPTMIFLGEATDLEGAPMRDYWQRVAKGPAAEADIGTAFYKAFWKPLEPFLTGVARVYVSPDGVLNRIAWAAIRSDDGHLLMEKYDIDVVLSTKDVLRQEHPSTSRRAVLIGNPAFDLSEAQQRAAVGAFRGKAGLRQPAQSSNAAVNPARGQRSRDTESHVLDLLPGTQREIESIGGLLQEHGWELETYTQQAALEEVIKSIKNPKVLHIATHGFFEPDQIAQQTGAAPDQPPGLEDPMLRSGLYFAGANRTLAGATPTDIEDGVMTAFEAIGLDLQGTELVVLSACETGLGRIRSGEGVFGLQRAMQEAGAEAVLMSMWSVPDTETQELITKFYSKWLSGKSKHEALHEAQLELRKETMAKWGDDRPYYWAAFVLVGR